MPTVSPGRTCPQDPGCSVILFQMMSNPPRSFGRWDPLLILIQAHPWGLWGPKLPRLSFPVQPSQGWLDASPSSGPDNLPQAVPLRPGRGPRSRTLNTGLSPGLGGEEGRAGGQLQLAPSTRDICPRAACPNPPPGLYLSHTHTHCVCMCAREKGKAEVNSL